MISPEQDNCEKNSGQNLTKQNSDHFKPTPKIYGVNLNHSRLSLSMLSMFLEVHQQRRPDPMIHKMQIRRIVSTWPAWQILGLQIQTRGLRGSPSIE